MDFWVWQFAFMVLSGIILLGRKHIDVPNPAKAFLIRLAGFVFVSTALSTFLQIAWSFPYYAVDNLGRSFLVPDTHSFHG